MYKYNPFTNTLDKVISFFTRDADTGTLEPKTTDDKLQMNNSISVDMDMTDTEAGLILENTGYTSGDSWLRLLDDDGTEQFSISRRDNDAKDRVRLDVDGGDGLLYFYARATIFQKSGGVILQLEGDNGDTHKIAAWNGSTRITTRGLSGYGVEIGPNDSPVIYVPTSGNVGIGEATPNSKLQVEGSLSLSYVAKTANYTLTSSDHTVDCTANTFTVTLPTAVGITGRIYNIKNTGTGVITVDGDGTETIDGELTQEINQWDCMKIQSTGANWIII